MVNLVYTEILKLRRSMMFILSMVGAVATPLLCLLGDLSMRAKVPSTVITFADFFADTNFGIVYLTGVPLYGVITTYLFYREYAEKTLDNLLTIPVSKANYVLSKLILLFFWIMALTLVGWIFSVLFGLLGQFVDLNGDILLGSLREYMLGGVFLFLLNSPVILITMVLKNYMPTVVFTAVVTMGCIMVANSEYHMLYPWTASLAVARSAYLPEYPPEYSWISILSVSIIGFIASMVYFSKSDTR